MAISFQANRARVRRTAGRCPEGTTWFRELAPGEQAGTRSQDRRRPRRWIDLLQGAAEDMDRMGLNGLRDWIMHKVLKERATVVIGESRAQGLRASAGGRSTSPDSSDRSRATRVSSLHGEAMEAPSHSGSTRPGDARALDSSKVPSCRSSARRRSPPSREAAQGSAPGCEMNPLGRFSRAGRGPYVLYRPDHPAAAIDCALARHRRARAARDRGHRGRHRDPRRE